MFTITAKDGNARAGMLETKTGKMETPFFMPVATRAVGKSIGSDDYNDMKAPCIIANALVLSMQPGTAVIKAHGSLHKFMHYNGSIFTDCGGFQISQESMFVKITKNGIHFKSPFDGKLHILTPEKIMQIEYDIGSDVAMVLDEMAPYGSSKEQFEQALEKTHRWAKDCLDAHKELRKQDKKRQLLFGIVQGGFFPDLRKESAAYLSSLDFDGIAIGGVAIGEPKKEMYQALHASLPFVDEKKPRYVMGVGSPEDVIACVGLGVDCFDSVYPTQNARRHTLFTWRGKLDIRKSKYMNDLSPIDEQCDCFVCKNFTKAYMHHLARINEPVGKRYRSYHNSYFMQQLMRKMRESIIAGTFEEFKSSFLKDWNRH
ncbi:MAG: tRNA guanosine(34) transglycosylase Tgt [archaeon]